MLICGDINHNFLKRKTPGNIHLMTKLNWLLFMCMLLGVWFKTLAQTPQPPRKPFIPRTIDWGYRIIEGDSAHPRKRYIFPFPIIAYKPEFRWILGVSVTHIFKAGTGKSDTSSTRPSYVRLNISYSQNKQFSLRPNIEYFSKDNRLNIRALYNYTSFGEYYWGIGNDAPGSNKEAYDFQMQRVNLKAAYRFWPKLYLGAQYNMETMYDIGAVPGGLLETSTVAGHNGYFASGAGFTLYYDDREHVYFPLKGNFIELSDVLYNKALGSEFNFHNITLDARKYVHLWRENVLAFQGVANLNYGNVPFRMMGVIGSDVYMRGYYNGRFRDNHMMAFQAELRKTVWGPVGIVAFAGFGNVSKTEDGLFSNIKPNAGVGVRIKAIPKQRVNVRFDYGRGSNGINAFYITMNEAF